MSDEQLRPTLDVETCVHPHAARVELMNNRAWCSHCGSLLSTGSILAPAILGGGVARETAKPIVARRPVLMLDIDGTVEDDTRSYATFTICGLQPSSELFLPKEGSMIEVDEMSKGHVRGAGWHISVPESGEATDMRWQVDAYWHVSDMGSIEDAASQFAAFLMIEPESVLRDVWTLAIFGDVPLTFNRFAAALFDIALNRAKRHGDMKLANLLVSDFGERGLAGLEDSHDNPAKFIAEVEKIRSEGGVYRIARGDDHA